MSPLIEANRSGSPTLSQEMQHAYPYDSVSPTTDFRWLGLALVKHRLVIVLTLISTIIPTAVYVQFAKPVYRASATIQVDPESVKVLPYKDVVDSLANPLPHFELYMKTQDELLRSNTLLSRVTKRIHKDLKPPALAGLPQPLSANLEVQRVEGSQMLRISYTAHDPVLAASIANAWAEEFLKLHADTRSQTGEKASQFLQSQLKALKLKVEKAEADLVDYARRHEILNIDSKQENVIRQRFSYLNGEVSRAEKDFIGRKAEYDGLRGVSAEDFPESLKSPAITALETRSFQAEQELSTLLSQFDDKWPAVSQKRQELTLVKAQLLEARKAVLARASKEAELKYSAARNEYDMLRRALNAQALLVSQLNNASVEYNTLRRELEASDQLYQGLLQRLKETGVSTGLELSNIQIAEAAQPEYTPYRPRKALSISLAVILGITLGVGISFVLESANNTLQDPWDVEKLGIPLLGWLPKSADKSGWRSLNDGAIRSEVPAPAALASATKRVDHSLTKSQYRAKECYRALCAAILLSRPDSPPRTLLISSAVPKEGKTTTTALLGVTFAEMGLPILLIDADLRNPSLARMFDIAASEGLSTYLAGGRLVIQETRTPNLYVLPSGPTPPNPVSLFSGDRMGEILGQLSSRFKVVLIDSPPVFSVTDATVLAAKVSGVLLIVRAAKTPKDIVKKALMQLGRTGSCILGAAVNQVDLQNPEYSYYRNYYYSEASNGRATPS